MARSTTPPWSPRALIARAAIIALGATRAGNVLAQGSPMPDSAQIVFGVRAIGLLTRATATPGGRTRTEGYLTQPMVMSHARLGPFTAVGTLDLEGLTLGRGELTMGDWGEGFVDRRHPHAYVHELMLGAGAAWHAGAVSLFAGRGFAPFGSDDPMVRPFVSYPVDHHLAQVLERIVLIGAGQLGPLVAEVATFNGDEPLDPSTPPLQRRFGDSWSARGTLLGNRIAPPLSAAELTLSYAMVKSPEYREGMGMNQRKLHGGVRVAADSRTFSRYALFEWARTTDVDRGRDLYTFSALLGEAAICSASATIALRVEQSERPEEERLLDPFRSPRPATDVSILGVTRWTTATAAASLPSMGTPFGAAPFVEVVRIGVVRTTTAVFDPSLLYGARMMWRTAAGVRLHLGAEHDRMGRYGAAAVPPMTAGSMSSRESHHSFTVRPMSRCTS